MTKTQHATLYTAAVLGHVLAAARCVLAAGPGLHAARIVVATPTEPDAYGRVTLMSLLSGVWTRTPLRGVPRQTADALTITEATAADFRVQLRNGVEVTPLAPIEHPQVYRPDAGT